MLDFPKFDDIGSIPYPLELKNLRKPEVKDTTIFEEMIQSDLKKYGEFVVKSFLEKIEGGVEIANYPQFREMREMFLAPMRKHGYGEYGYDLKEEKAKITEVELLKEFAREHHDHDKTWHLRSCVSGPLELYIHEFSYKVDHNLLMVLASAVNKFLKNSVVNEKNIKTVAVCIDEPTLGFGDIQVDKETLISAWNKATIDINAEVQIHLHRPLAYDTVCDTEGIDVIGIESAANPGHVEEINKALLLKHDKSLRLGVARSDFEKLGALYNEKNGGNVWKELNAPELILGQETPQIIEDRLNLYYKNFGDLLKYVGADCGCGWGFIDSGYAINFYKKIRKALDNFRASG